MVFSVKANKNKIIAALALLFVVVGGIIFVPKMTKSPTDLTGETHEQRLEFLESFGWEIGDTVDEREVTIPTTFSEVYTTYNIMQKAQGFDLEPYSGKICTQYIYIVENYASSDEVHATVLVYEGNIIGGDISCSEIDGFMHGFAVDSEAYGGGESHEASEAEQTDADLEDGTSSGETSSESSDSSSGESSVVTDKSGEPYEED